jgi:ketosteroid isomerase-like protein
MMGRCLKVIAAVVLLIQPSCETAPKRDLASEAQEIEEFRAFLAKVYDAQVELVQGRPAAFKALCSHASDVTIFGGFGSGDRGWENVESRLDWGGAQFSEGSRSHEVLNTYVNGGVGYVVQIERIRYKIPGKSEESLLELRATMIMRREAEGWRIAHRHADSQMTRQAPQ